MRTVRLVFGISVAVLFLGCKTAQSAAQVEAPPEDLRTPMMCSAQMKTTVNEQIKSIDSGTISGNYAALPDEYLSPIVVSTSKQYFYDNTELTSQFELIYSGVRTPPDRDTISKDDILGYAVADAVTLTARSKTIDPYLVACSNVQPVKYDDYWYYFPGMYVPSEMKWLSFRPVDYPDFKSMYDHATDPDEFYGMTLFNWWSLYETVLDEYPESIVTQNGESVTQLILYKDLPLRLNYQKDFLTYLRDEYVLGSPIYLYLQITGISGFSKEFECYVRDFSLIPPEEIVRKRIELVMDK